MCAPQIVVDYLRVQLVLVGDGIIGLGVQVQDGHGVREARLGRLDLQGGFKSVQREETQIIIIFIYYILFMYLYY